MMRALALALLLATPAAAQDAATPAFAPGTYGDPFDDTGLFQGCIADAGVTVCTITSRLANLVARSDTSPAAPFAALQGLPADTPVAVTGDITAMGDVSADIVLSTVETGEPDPYAATLAALQGAWVSLDDPAYALEFAGNEQIETYDGAVQGYYMTSLEAACPDGTGPGPVLFAVMMGGDSQAETWCYTILKADGTMLEMTLEGGNGSTLRFRRP